MFDTVRASYFHRVLVSATLLLDVTTHFLSENCLWICNVDLTRAALPVSFDSSAEGFRLEMGIEPNPSNKGSFQSLVLSALSALADN